MKSVLGLMILLILGDAFGQEAVSVPCGNNTSGPEDFNPTDVICRRPGQILPNEQHCRLYYTCLDNLCPVMGFCELGMWFDRDLFVCDYPKYVKNCPAWID